MCWGLERGKMVAYVTLFAVSLEVERGLSGERMPRELSGFVWNTPHTLSQSCLLSELHLQRTLEPGPGHARAHKADQAPPEHDVPGD